MIGGGLAGLAAACALADQGVSVTLLEKRPFVGGRAFSFVHPQNGQEVDNGQHVYLGCCTAYTDFLDRLGVRDRAPLQRRLRVPVRDANGRQGALSAARFLPAPLHLLPSLLAYPHLSLGDKFRAILAMLRILRTDRERDRPALEAMTFRQWLEGQGQSARAVAALWDLIILPVLNDTVDDASAYMGLMAFQEGVLGGRHSADLGYARVGLTPLISDAVQAYLARRGGRILPNRTVGEIVVEDGRAVGVRTADGLLSADAVVSAVPWDVLPTLLPPEAAGHPFFAPADRLQWAPIVGVHVWYDRPVMSEEFVATLDSPVQWIFNKTRMQSLPGPGQYLCVSVSAAWEHADMTREALRPIFLEALARLLPEAADATVVHFTVVKQLSATFRCLPGAQAHRLPQETPVAGLVLAGDWTETGWPATMESAVRSGRLAATAVARALEMETKPA